MHERFEKRVHAGWCLGECLKFKKTPKDMITVGIARGGVPVAAIVANSLRTPLDVLVVNKIWAPGDPPSSIGAITSSGEYALNEKQVLQLLLSEEQLRELRTAAQEIASQREQLYRASVKAPDWKDRPVLLVDDIMEGGTTMRAAVKEARRRGAAQVLASVPVAAFQALEAVKGIADDAISLRSPESFQGIAEWYWEPLPATDLDVQKILQRHVKRAGAEQAAAAVC